MVRLLAALLLVAVAIALDTLVPPTRSLVAQGFSLAPAPRSLVTQGFSLAPAPGSLVAQGFRLRRFGGQVSLAPAAIQDKPKADEKPRDPAVEALFLDALGVPPEFSTDLLIRIATSSRLDDRAWTLEMLELAYVLAGAAEQPTPLALMEGAADTRTASLALASEAGLDRVTLQSRLVAAMTAYDPPRARELFSYIDFDIEPTPCAEAAMPDPAPYFTALTTITRRTFGTSARDRDDALRFMELAIWRARLPRELVAAVKAVREYGGDRYEYEYLFGVLSTVLERGVRDERGFASVGFELARETAKLADEGVDQSLFNAGRLMQSLRKYLVYQLQGPRCEDGTAAAAADQFNAYARRWKGASDDITTLTAREATPSKNGGSATLMRYWETPDARRLNDEARTLFGGYSVTLPIGRGRTMTRVRPPTTESEKNTDAWRKSAEQHLANVLQWNGAREKSDTDYFHQKAALLTRLIEGVPSEAIRLRAVRELVSFLRQTGPRRDRYQSWFYRSRPVFALARRSRNAEAIYDALTASSQPVLSLYARVERTIPAAARATQ